MDEIGWDDSESESGGGVVAKLAVHLCRMSGSEGHRRACKWLSSIRVMSTLAQPRNISALGSTLRIG